MSLFCESIIAGTHQDTGLAQINQAIPRYDRSNTSRLYVEGSAPWKLIAARPFVRGVLTNDKPREHAVTETSINTEKQQPVMR